MKAIPCQHVADYYQYQWENRKNIGNNLLRIGYRQCAQGGRITFPNNLYGKDES